MLRQFFVAFTTFLLIDGIWLSIVAKDFYAQHLGFLLAKTPNFWAAGFFYLVYIFSLVVLVLSPAIQKESLQTAVVLGALFGFCAYATYDLTNLATIKDWPLLVTIVDLIWGTALTASVSGISYLVLTKWL